MKQWKEEHCAERPNELQEIAKGLYMQRRNIKEIEKEDIDGIGTYKEYVCESREITVDEYEMLKSIEQINTNKVVDEYTLQLIEEGIL